MRHASVPFKQIVNELLPKRMHDPSRNAVFQAMFTWQDGLTRSVGSAFGDSLKAQPPSNAGLTVAKCEITLHAATSAAGGIDGSVEFNSDLFTRDSIERLATHLVALAGSLADAPA